MGVPDRLLRRRRCCDEFQWQQCAGYKQLRCTLEFNSSFYGVGSYAYFWSSSENDADNAWTRFLYSGSDDLNRYYDDKKNGYSVRCLKDGP